MKRVESLITNPTFIGSSERPVYKKLAYFKFKISQFCYIGGPVPEDIKIDA